MRFFIVFLLLLSFVVQPSEARRSSRKGGEPAAPKVFTYTDLKRAASDYRYSFYFFPVYVAAKVKARLPHRAADSYPNWRKSYRIRRKRLYAGGNGYNFLSFPWKYNSIKEGDIVFIRGGDSSSAVNRYFSTWTHCAMIYNKDRGETFESLKERGVEIYDYKKAWRNFVSYSVKRVQMPNPKGAVNRAVSFYKGTSYFPKGIETTKGLWHFFRKWSDKNDLDSIYCSKLVWLTFIDYGLDLDSERTSTSKFRHPRPINGGPRINPNAWIGVSPDDIYYSTYLSNDIVIRGQEFLNEPLSDHIF